MILSSGLDPFTVFGVERRLDLDEKALERRYLHLSRECHPDLHRSKGAGDCAAVLARSAEVNDCWRVLKDRWLRAQALIDLAAPQAMLQQRRLDPEFLAKALELAEEVADSAPADRPSLKRRLLAELDGEFASLVAAASQGDFEAAARRLHESKYLRKALADLDSLEQGDAP